jgi:hypothetical protein
VVTWNGDIPVYVQTGDIQTTQPEDLYFGFEPVLGVNGVE